MVSQGGDDEQCKHSDGNNGSKDPVKEVTQLFAQTNVHDIPSFRYVEVSAEAREAALQELHGALDLVRETPEFLERKLKEFEGVAASYPFLTGYAENGAYNMAFEQNPSYVNDLKLMFLRAEKFDVAKAVIRMFSHFEARLSLFRDPKILGRDIVLSDFVSPEDKCLLEQGLCQLLPARDRVGRPIIFLYSPQPDVGVAYNDAKQKVFFWMGLLASRMGEDVQRKGLVVVWHGINSESKGNPSRGVAYFRTMSCLSTAVSSVHALYDKPEVTRSMNAIVANAEKSDIMFRFRTHYGSNIACLHTLMAYGIPRGSLPVDFDGSLRLDDHKRFLERARTGMDPKLSVEESDYGQVQPNSLAPQWDHEATFATRPTEMDIICGRGQRGSKNPGNLLLKRLLEEKVHTYSDANRHGKALITQEIYTAMRQAGCRFLVPAEEARTAQDRHYKPELWKEVDEIAARDRIAHKFRNMRKPIT